MCKAHDYIDLALKSDSNEFIFIPKGEDVEMSNSGELKDMVVALKDNLMVSGWPISAGSKILDGHIAAYDATVVKKLIDAGATLNGKTNLDEFAMGSSTENSAFGATKNPWDRERVPGGSSGGSAAAVAADMADAALGSDTGGSIRQPAAFCSVTGLKPTYGSVSRYGMVALASSLDVIGPIARSAEDVERVFSVISGQDPLDQTTFDYSYRSVSSDISKLKIGLPNQLWDLDIDPEIKAATEKFVEFFKSKGAEISRVDLPSIPLALNAYYIILPAEASANLSRYDGIRYRFAGKSEDLLGRYKETRIKFGSEVKRRILLGTYALSVGHYEAYYQLATRVRRKITKEYAEVFKVYDALISPTTPTVPFKLGERVKDPVAMYQSDLLTVSANLAGIPAISVPIGFTESALPIGGQIIAEKAADNVIISLAKQYQQETDWHSRKSNG